MTYIHLYIDNKEANKTTHHFNIAVFDRKREALIAANALMGSSPENYFYILSEECGDDIWLRMVKSQKGRVGINMAGEYESELIPTPEAKDERVFAKNWTAIMTLFRDEKKKAIREMANRDHEAQWKYGFGNPIMGVHGLEEWRQDALRSYGHRKVDFDHYFTVAEKVWLSDDLYFMSKIGESSEPLGNGICFTITKTEGGYLVEIEGIA